MSVAQILRAIYGTYIPTGVYSFEFRKPGKKITEIYFLLPPEDVSVSEGERSSIAPTLTGNYISDFGNEIKEITVSGSLYFYYAGSPKYPLSRLPEITEGFVDGFSEFLKLRFMCMRYRDYTMTEKGKLDAPKFSGTGLANVDKFKDKVKKMISSGQGALADAITVIFHDYDYNDHWKVKIDNFTASRSKDDPFSVKYSITMKAYEQDTTESAGAAKAPDVKLTPGEMIDQITALLASAPVDPPDSLKKDINLFLLGEKNDVVRSYIEWANGMIKSGVMTPARALTVLDDNFPEGEIAIEDNILTVVGQ